VAHVGAGAHIYRNAVMLSASMLAGMCEETRDMASAYAKMREQFGQPIGKFQAVKHKCADMAIRSDAVNALVSFASVTVRDGRDDADFQVAAAKLLASQYALLNAKENIQVHGAIGFTTDLPAHLFLKRAHVLDHFCGAVRRQQRNLLAQTAAQ
jgi:alkylation response protein AidB-like acyl-CoA dehydrogenase